jgi:hypothetical protein
VAAVAAARAPAVVVEVSTVAAVPMVDTMEEATAAAIVAALLRLAVAEPPRDPASVPSGHAAQMPDIPGPGKVAAARATHLPDGISSILATVAGWVAKGRQVPQPDPAFPQCQEGQPPCQITPQ